MPKPALERSWLSKAPRRSCALSLGIFSGFGSLAAAFPASAESLCAVSACSVRRKVAPHALFSPSLVSRPSPARRTLRSRSTWGRGAGGGVGKAAFPFPGAGSGKLRPASFRFRVSGFLRVFAFSGFFRLPLSGLSGSGFGPFLFPETGSGKLRPALSGGLRRPAAGRRRPGPARGCTAPWPGSPDPPLRPERPSLKGSAAGGRAAETRYL